jgi:hypothetical protein
MHIYIYVPITTAMHEQMIMDTERPANAHAYCEMRFPRPSVTPPAIAIRTEGQLSCICHHIYNGNHKFNSSQEAGSEINRND